VTRAHIQFFLKEVSQVDKAIIVNTLVTAFLWKVYMIFKKHG